MCEILRWVLVILGTLFILLSFAGALIIIIKKYRTVPNNNEITPESLPDLDKLTTFMSALKELIGTMGTAPTWLVCFAGGIGLIVFSNSVFVKMCAG